MIINKKALFAVCISLSSSLVYSAQEVQAVQNAALHSQAAAVIFTANSRQSLAEIKLPEGFQTKKYRWELSLPGEKHTIQHDEEAHFISEDLKYMLTGGSMHELQQSPGTHQFTVWVGKGFKDGGFSGTTCGKAIYTLKAGEKVMKLKSLNVSPVIG